MRKTAFLARCLFFTLVGGMQNASAVVWSSVNSTVVTNNVSNCTNCHSGVNTYSGFLSGFTTPTAAANAVNTGYMPKDLADLDSTRKATIVNWAAQGAPLSAATASTSTITSQQKTSVTLRGNVDTNSGYSGGQWYFEYGTTTSYLSGKVSVTTRNVTNFLAATYSLTGLSCGTNYNYRLVAKNGNNTANGSNQAFSTTACSPPTITQGAATNQATNENAQDTFSLNYSVGESGTRTWSIITQGSKGTYSFDTSTTASPVTVRYTPASNQNGSDTAGRIRVTNSTTGLSDSIAINMAITAINDQPSITSTASTSAVEDTLYTYTVAVDDPDDAFGAGLSIVLSNQPGDMAVNSSTGQITWTPVNGDTTSGLVTVTVTDGLENGTVAAVQQFTVSVSGTNDPPVITPGASTTATEDVQYSYQMQVTDIDDTNNGTDITYLLANQPSGMSISSTGLISWTPVEGVLTSGILPVIVTVEDGNEDSSVPGIANNGQESFTISVTSVNDAPVVTPGALTTANEEDNYSYQIVVIDPDDVNNGTDLSFTPNNFPTGMSLSSTGLITWLVPRTGTDVSYNSVTVTVKDGGEDAATSSAEVFNLAISIVDGDSDTVADYADNCPGVANLGQEDMDNDTVRILPQLDPDNFPPAGDVDPTARDAANVLAESYLNGGDACDEDIDGDGLSNTFENMFAFLDPMNAADAAGDEDGDGISNLDEFLASTSPDVDSVGPVVNAPSDITVDATGLLTAITLGSATSNDGNDGEIVLLKAAVDLTQTEKDALAVTITGCQLFSNYETEIKPFRPGSHTVTWATCDSSGNSGQQDQIVNVRPLVSVSTGQSVGEGQPVNVDVILNGEAIAYPATVQYTLTGTAAVDDYDGVDGTVMFNSPGEGGSINFNTVADGVTEGDETVIITLHSPINITLGNIRRHTVTITEANLAPRATLNVSQAVTLGNTVYQPDGIVSVVVNATDGNGDALSYSWNGTDETLLNAAGTSITLNQLDFDPAVLNADSFYTVTVSVSDGSSAITVTRLLQVNAGEINIWLLTDDFDGDGITNLAEAYGDIDADGVPDYLDNLSTPANAIEDQTANLATRLYIETDPGLKIALGETAVAARSSGVLIGLQDIVDYGGAGGVAVSNAATDYIFLSGLLNFEISGLTDDIESANVVIPLPSAIQEGFVYRKYNASGWFDFVEDDLNQLRSAVGSSGICPPPGSNLYTPGLTIGDLCLQLTIQDGGFNDADGVRDYVVKDPGGLALVPESEDVAVAASDSGGRAGSMSAWLVLMLSALFISLWRARAAIAVR